MTDKKRPPPWTDRENTACIALYFTMLGHATAGTDYVKADMIREANGQDKSGNIVNHAALLVARGRASIERKLMNCTAAHAALTAQPDGTPTVKTMDGFGYRAAPNMQAALKDAMRTALRHRRLSGANARVSA